MRIVFDPSTLHQSKKGSVTGVVYFDFGADQQFPVGGWNDFVVVIACWWLDALHTVGHAKANAVLRFMDGPFWIAVNAEEGSKVSLRCIEDRRGARPVREVIIDQAELQRELMEFAQTVSRTCAAAGIESADVDNLRRLLPK
jgi:hypothetical protein